MLVNTAFGSDNHSGMHPDILEALRKANYGFAIAYGEDTYTKHAVQLFKQHFGQHIDVFFLYNGTATNILGLKAVTHSYNSIICAETAHLNVHECCGPENFLGCKLVTIKTPDGKLTSDLVLPHLTGFEDPHVAQPKVISITQPTELGTLYSLQEIKDVTKLAHANNMLVHMDGARLSNAAAALNISFKQLTKEAGIDLVSFGGTKNGMMFGEAVIFCNTQYSKNFQYIRKQGMQLASKMRYISAQFEAFLSNDLWLRNAQHANAMAHLLAQKLHHIPQIKITQKVQANAIFIQIPPALIPKIRKYYFFHLFDEKNHIARLMCSFNTTKKDVENFVDTIRKICTEKK